MTCVIMPSGPKKRLRAEEHRKGTIEVVATAHGQEPRFLELWEQVSAYTMTSPERGYALWLAVNSVIDRGIPGAFVECGVWRGGSSMLMALTLSQRGTPNRDLFLFDTFEGMTRPGPEDVSLAGDSASDLLRGIRGDRMADLVRAAAGEEEVRMAMASTGYDMRMVRLVQGDVAHTLSKTQTMQIALLRLDTDFYDSTLAELDHLYPRLMPGGILIIDDYGHWRGARKAVHDYFARTDHGFQLPMLWPIDYTGRGAMKIEPASSVEIVRYDYVPPGMTPPDLLPLFPEALAQSPWPVQWPHLRKTIPHLWRSDARGTGPATGNASVEEAACLYTLAKPFAGGRGLEIGTHFGWTAAHLLAAGLRLDCVDTAFDDPTRIAAVSQALDSVPCAGTYRLWAGASPGILAKVRAADPDPFAFAFIDGNHDGDAPAEDARAVIPLMAEDACVVFHDMTSPHVAAGLEACARAGFRTRLWNTQQILGVAWRGNVDPPEHVADPNTLEIFYPHLVEFLGA